MKTKKRTSDTPKTPKPAETHHSHKKWYVIAGIAILVLATVVGWTAWFYYDRALPNVAVGSVAVGNQTPAAIRSAITQQAPALSITFDDNGHKTTVPAKDVGVVVDVEATLQNVLSARRGGDIQLWQTDTVPLVLANDPGVLIAYAHQHFPSVFVDAKEPEVTYSDQTGQFELTRGVPGKGLDIKSFEQALPQLAKQPRGFTLKLTTQPVQPLLDETKLVEVRDEANQRIHQTVAFTHNGTVVDTAKPAEIASWAHFVPDVSHATVQLEFDTAKIQQFITQRVGPKVASLPVDRKVVVDSQTGAQTVLQQGRAGSQIQDVETLGKDVQAALAADKSFSKDVSIASAPFKTVTMTGTGKWIEVDLSKQRLTMYLGDQVVMSVLISSGRAGTPTEVGEFAIYYKTPSQTMTGTIAGDYFYLPNVKWVSYFDGDEAFHGTYWHHNFGHPMSHGCINMTEADAKTLYDFAPVGTKVIVHA